MDSRKGALLALVALCLAVPALAGLHDPPHALEQFSTASFATVINPAILLTLNTTTLTTTKQSVLLTIAGPPSLSFHCLFLSAHMVCLPVTCWAFRHMW